MSARPFIFAPSQAGLPSSDTFSLSGQNCPGKCELISCAATQAWDIREANGFNWATVAPKGEKLSEPTFLVEIWEGETQYTDWLAYALQFLSRPAPASPGTVASKAFGFTHDIASLPPYLITSVLVQGVDYRGRGDGGSYLHAVRLLEFKKPIPVLPRPDQSTTATAKTVPVARTALQQNSLDTGAQIAALNPPPPVTR